MRARSYIVPILLILPTLLRALALSPGEQAWIQAHPVIRIQMANSSPPFEYRDQGQPKGLALDYLRTVAASLGLKVEVTSLGWVESLNAIQKPDPPVDLLLCVTDSDERRHQMRLTRPFVSFPMVILTTKQHHFIGGLHDLESSRVAVEATYVTEAWLRRDLPQAAILASEDGTEGALKLVSDGQADAYVGNLATATYVIDRAGLANLKVAAPSGYHDEAFSMGVRRDWPELVGLLDRGFNALSSEQETALRHRWLTLRYEHGLRLQDVVLWALAVGLIGLLFNYQLKRQVAAHGDALKAQAVRLADAEKRAALSTLAAGTAHDFNNVLAAVGLGLESIAEREADPALAKEMTDIVGSVRHAGELVSQLNLLGRTEKAKAVALDPAAALNEAAVLLKAAAPPSLRLHSEAHGGAQALGDPVGLKRVLMNLGSNAIQAMEGRPGELRLTVDEAGLEDEPGRAWIRFKVADTGPGLDEALQAKIFEPYFTRRRDGTGTGLGLAVVKHLVEAMDGRVRVISRPGVGSVFEVYLPKAG